ncbi:MAG: type II secretion system protein [Methylotenera sp.]|nr:type II secretion system protein [Methylotenera sp.]
MIKAYKSQKGFSLIELAVVLIILGFVLGALLLPLQAQRQQLFQSQTENTLEIAKKSLLGFAQAKGRLPCPATVASNGLEMPLGGAACTSQLGYLPAATLGIQPTDANGFALDAWGNRIMYAVAQNSTTAAPPNTATPDFTTNNATDGMNVIGMTTLTPELRVCKSATGITAAACSGGTESNYLINNAVVVMYSLGATGAQAAGGADENANPNVPTNPKSVFVSHEVTAVGAANGEFDHIVTWISPYVLYNAMIEAGQLH